MFGFIPDDIAATSGVLLYVAIVLLPFVQEDAAVIGAATASIHGLAPPALLFVLVLIGLAASDGWKYWIGRFARRYRWAHRFAAKPGVALAGTLVEQEFVQTMLTARFVPGTRIPTYIACGFFKAPYARYMITLVATAMAYVTLMFALFHIGGAVAGERAKVWLPLIAIGLLAGYIAYRMMIHRAGEKSRGPVRAGPREGAKT